MKKRRPCRFHSTIISCPDCKIEKSLCHIHKILNNCHKCQLAEKRQCPKRHRLINGTIRTLNETFNGLQRRLIPSRPSVTVSIFFFLFSKYILYKNFSINIIIEYDNFIIIISDTKWFIQKQW